MADNPLPPPVALMATVAMAGALLWLVWHLVTVFRRGGTSDGFYVSEEAKRAQSPADRRFERLKLVGAAAALVALAIMVVLDGLRVPLRVFLLLIGVAFAGIYVPPLVELAQTVGKAFAESGTRLSRVLRQIRELRRMRQ